MEELKILVVDDDENILFAFQQVLENEGYRSVEAKDGVEALEKFAMEHPLIIFMDLSMSNTNGMEVLRQIKALDSKIPVILIHGLENSDTTTEARNLGVFDFMSKPLSLAGIRDVIRRALA